MLRLLSERRHAQAKLHSGEQADGRGVVVGGREGAKNIAALFKKRGIKFEFVENIDQVLKIAIRPVAGGSKKIKKK